MTSLNSLVTTPPAKTSQAQEPKLTLPSDRYVITKEYPTRIIETLGTDAMSRFEKAHPEDRDGRWAAQTSAVTGFVAGIFKDANLATPTRVNIESTLCGEDCAGRIGFDFKPTPNNSPMAQYFVNASSKIVRARDKQTNESVIVIDSGDRIFANSEGIAASQAEKFRKNLVPVGKAGAVFFQDKEGRTIAFGPQSLFDDSNFGKHLAVVGNTDVSSVLRSESSKPYSAEEALQRTFSGIAIKDGKATPLTKEEVQDYAKKWGPIFSLNRS